MSDAAGLIARSQAEASENDEAVLAVLTAAGEEGLKPGALFARLELSDRTVRNVLSRLEERRLIRRDGKRRIWASAAARSESAADLSPPLAPALERAIGHLPAEPLRAMTRLQLSAVPVRWHQAETRSSGWCGFISLGPTKTGKTSIAALVCRVFGLDERTAVRVAQTETPGSMVGRRQPDRAHPSGYRFDRSPLLDLPYVCVDEWDKAPKDVKSAASGLLLGNTVIEQEGERLVIRPTVYVTLNTGRAGLGAMHEAHVRRSVVIDTAPLRPLLVDLDERMDALFNGPTPRMNLRSLRPGMLELPSELRAELRAELRRGLTDEGWDHTDIEPVARLAIGRHVMTDCDLEQATLATALDYLSCASTIGHTRDGFASRLAARLSGDPAASAAAAEEEAERWRLHERQRERDQLADRLAFQADRERLYSTMISERDAMGRARDIERQAVAQALSVAAEAIRGARSRNNLDIAWEAAQPYIEQAQAWRANRDAAAREQELAARRERYQRDIERTLPGRRRRPTTSRGPATQEAPLRTLTEAFTAAFEPFTAARTRDGFRSATRVSAGVGRCPTCDGRFYAHQYDGRCPRCGEPLLSA